MKNSPCLKVNVMHCTCNAVRGTVHVMLSVAASWLKVDDTDLASARDACGVKAICRSACNAGSVQVCNGCHTLTGCAMCVGQQEAGGTVAIKSSRLHTCMQCCDCGNILTCCVHEVESRIYNALVSFSA